MIHRTVRNRPALAALATRAGLIALAAALALVAGQALAAAPELPRIQMNHGALQLMVAGKPYLMRGGEFANNVYEAPAHIQYLEMMLDAYKDSNLNTVLVPISWRSLEPREGTFDLRLIDALIEQCLKRDMRVVVLWFGAIKNGGLHYAPRWVIDDRNRFFRARKADGKEVYAVSPFCEAAWTADRTAFIKLMERIKEKDTAGTVVMIQPENETGCQEIDNERDHCAAADVAWQSAVPDDLARYLAANDGKLIRWFQAVWDRAGKKSAGTWPQVFGDGVDGQKIFMSYYIGKFIERVASAGKAVRPLPMFINDWLGSIESPGGPIGGPDYQMIDVFRVTTPSSFACVPDIYQSNFKAWLAAYHQKDNPILVPEAGSGPRAAQQCWYTYCQHDGLLYAPYMMVPNEADQKSVPANVLRTNLKLSYGIIKEMDEIILARQGLVPRELICFQLDQNERADNPFMAEFQGYSVAAQPARASGGGRGGAGGGGRGAGAGTPPFAALVKMGTDDFVIIGKTMRLEFQKPGLQIKSAERGQFQANRWAPGAAFSAEAAAGKVAIPLTDAPDAIDLVRVKLKVE